MLHIMRKMCNIPPPLTNIYGCFFNFRHNYIPGFDCSNAIIVIGILKAHYTVLETFIEPLQSYTQIWTNPIVGLKNAIYKFNPTGLSMFDPKLG